MNFHITPTQSLTDNEFEALEDFLMSEATPKQCMDTSIIDGFFAAIALNPIIITPSQWLPWIWDMENGKESPKFSSREEASCINDYLLRYYNMVSQSIAEGWFLPLFMEVEQQDGSEFFDATGWCMGFMLGVSIFVDPWKPIMENHFELIAPMGLLGTDKGMELLENSNDIKRATKEAYEAIPDAIDDLYAYFTAHPHTLGSKHSISMERRVPFQRGEKKAGRNDLCPCGSGKKYKKCCGGKTLH